MARAMAERTSPNCRRKIRDWSSDAAGARLPIMQADCASGRRDLALGGLHDECFACGVANSDGLSLHFEVGGDGVARAGWQPEAAYGGYPGRLHGGVIATLLDSAMVHALASLGVAGVTVELTIRYRGAVGLTTPIEARGHVDGERRGVYFCHAEIVQGGREVVRARAKFMEFEANSGSW